MKKQKIASNALFIATALALVLSLATTFAWFSSRFVTRDFTFTTARLASSVTISQATDFDLDGYPDLNADGTEDFITISKQEILENESLAYYILSPTTANNSAILPSEIRTFKVHVINNGTVKSEMRAELYLDPQTTVTDEYKLFLKSLVLTPVLINSDHSITECTEVYVGDQFTDSGNFPSVLTFISNDSYTDYVYATNNKGEYVDANGQVLENQNDPTLRTKVKDYAEIDFRNTTINGKWVTNTKDFYFRLEMLSYDDFVNHYFSESTPTISREEYSKLQGKQYKVTLMIALVAQEFGQSTTQNTPTN